MRLLEHSGTYVASSVQPIARVIAGNDLAGCNGCAVAPAREVGAEAVATGLVQKVSALILSVNIAIRAVPGGQVIASGSVDLSGDDDVSWQRGAAWLVADRLLRPGRPG